MFLASFLFRLIGLIMQITFFHVTAFLLLTCVFLLVCLRFTVSIDSCFFASPVHFVTWAFAFLYISSAFRAAGIDVYFLPIFCFISLTFFAICLLVILLVFVSVCGEYYEFAA